MYRNGNADHSSNSVRLLCLNQDIQVLRRSNGALVMVLLEHFEVMFCLHYEIERQSLYCIYILFIYYDVIYLFILFYFIFFFSFFPFILCIY